jgi:cytochrome P450
MASGRHQAIPYPTLTIPARNLGPVVRTAPNELSFNTSASWRDIYGPRREHRTFTKGNFYTGANFAASPDTQSIVSEQDPAVHTEMRRVLAPAFSERSIREQEHLVTEIIDLFIHRMEELGPGGVDLSQWLKYITFDIIGSLSFGHSFGSVASGEEHPWAGFVLKGLGFLPVVESLNRLGFSMGILDVLPLKSIDRLKQSVADHETFTLDLIKKHVIL